jgi:hypothetical protein
MADKATVVPPRDPWPFSTVTVGNLEALVADGLLRPLSGDPQPEWMAPRERPTRLSRGGMWLVLSPSTSGGLECQRAASCGRSCTTTGWSCTTSTPTPLRKRPSSRRFARVFWGLTATGSVDPSLLCGAFCLDGGGKDGPHGGAGRWLHPPVEAGARAAVHPRHPCVFEQGVAAPVVLSPERRQKAPVVFSTSSDRRRQLALGGHARETRESPASSGGLAEVTRWGAHRCGGCSLWQSGGCRSRR